MAELRGAVTHDDLMRHLQLGQLLTLELVRIDIHVAGQVQLHVDQRRGQVFGRAEALAELAGRLDLVDQGLRDRLAGLIVQGELVQHLLGRQPVLVQLAGELDIVARHGRARHRRIGGVGVQAVQGVAELVEQGGGVVPRDQQGLAGLALDEVGVVRDDRGDLALEPLLRAVGVHPRARALARAGIGVEVPQAHVLAGLGHLIDGDVLVIDGDAFQLLVLEAVELARGPEHALAQLVQLQVRLHLVHIEGVLRQADLLGVETVVPRLQLEPAAFLVDDRLHVGDVDGDLGDGRGPHRLHQRHGVFRRLGHGVLEAPVGVGLVAQQLGALDAQLQDLADDGVVVGRAAVVAAVDERAPDLLARRADRALGQERVDAGAGVDDDELARKLARGGVRGRGVLQALGQAGQIGVRQLDPGVLVGQQVLAELGVEAGQFGVDRADTGLGFGRELSARAHEVAVVDPQHALLFRRQLGLFRRIVDRLDAGEERGVLVDLVTVGRQLGIHLLLDRLELRRAHVRAPDAVIGLNVVQHPAGVFQRADGVVEGRRGLVGRDRVDLGQVLGHGRFQGRLEVGDLDLVESGHAAIGADPLLGHRIVGLGHCEARIDGGCGPDGGG